MRLTKRDRQRIYCKYYGIGCSEQDIDNLHKEYPYVVRSTIYNVINDEKNEPTKNEFENLNIKKTGNIFNNPNENAYHLFKEPYHSLNPNSRFYYKLYERYQNRFKYQN